MRGRKKEKKEEEGREAGGLGDAWRWNYESQFPF